MEGLYECRQDDSARHIMINVKETENYYTFKLLENTTQLDYDHFIMLFKDSDTVRINKKKSPHAMMLWDDGDFTIYPFRAGIPFWFKKVEMRND